jgi:hypothetical protein
MDMLPLSFLDGAGVVSIAALVIVAYMRGWVVTPREHDEALRALKAKDAQIAEKDKQLGYLAEVGRTVEQFTRGLQEQMRDDR